MFQKDAQVNKNPIPRLCDESKRSLTYQFFVEVVEILGSAELRGYCGSAVAKYQSGSILHQAIAAELLIITLKTAIEYLNHYSLLSLVRT